MQQKRPGVTLSSTEDPPLVIYETIFLSQVSSATLYGSSKWKFTYSNRHQSQVKTFYNIPLLTPLG